jgi:hypothetical protein
MSIRSSIVGLALGLSIGAALADGIGSFGPTLAAIFGSFAGDCTASANGTMTCTKTNGVSYAPSATTDTTNAANIASGTLASARMPRPAATVGSGGSQLPTCNAAAKGQMYIVSDALSPIAIATVVGGGGITIGVTCNGSNWIVQ